MHWCSIRCPLPCPLISLELPDDDCPVDCGRHQAVTVWSELDVRDGSTASETWRAVSSHSRWNQ